MRVLAMLHLYPEAHNGGAEMMAHAMLRALVDTGHEVDVQLSQRHNQITAPYELDGVRVWPPSETGKLDVHRWLDDTDVIVTHLENTPRAMAIAMMTEQLGRPIPLISLQHNTFEMTKNWCRPWTTAVYNSEWMRADYEAWFRQVGRPAPPSIVVRPPVWPAEYATVPGDRVTLINLYEPKGSPLFWELARRMPDVQFLGVIGAYGEQVVEELPNVEIVPHGPRIRDRVYARTRVLLMPSRYESWGRCAVEAAASGIPTIAHPTPGLTESLGDAGIFCDRDDADGWETALRQVLDGRRWKAASRRALARSAELDPTEDLNRWVSTVEGVAARGRSRRLVSA